ncbi:MAG TPA: hypothetical protein DEA97_06435 [Bacteroidales bacterium]|nr:MAG: hypothetical protein UR43_C0021G0013 [candidate division TM6 bacterium GW2011_GWF2_33_332]OFY79629.1 MAG: hypothetical protein A2281_13470 [Bacteroidetes bacterium RIFOXYA12_FULL_38_20]HBS86172.1 hypothetical protein [Bacteroidales bacterium]
MQNIFDIHDYDEHFLEQFTGQTIPIYDRWNIRPLQNEQKILESGTSEEVDKFMNFITEHAQKEYPHPIVIVVGNVEKNNPSKMLTSTMKYFKMKFDKFKGHEIGSPLPIGYAPNNQQPNPMIPIPFLGLGQKNPTAGGMQGITYNEIQGIIDRNVSDATRSIRAEYEENSAKREAESIKRIAELELKMEMYKLDLRAKEIDEKERRLQEELEGLEQKKEEGLGTVKDYTKTIAGGLLEFGKFALGFESVNDDEKKDNKKPAKEKTSSTSEKPELGSGSTIDDDGFSKKTDNLKSNTKEDKEEGFKQLKEIIAELDENQKMALLEMLMPDEPEEEEEEDSSDVQTQQQATSKKKNTNKKSKKDEEVQSDNNNQ